MTSRTVEPIGPNGTGPPCALTLKVAARPKSLFDCMTFGEKLLGSSAAITWDQRGSELGATVTQQGSGNAVEVTQSGSGYDVSITQNGDNNSLRITYSGPSEGGGGFTVVQNGGETRHAD